MGWVEEVEVSAGRGQRKRDGRWVRFRGGYRDGAGVRHRKTFDTKGAAGRWVRAEEEAVARDEWQAPALRKVTVGEYWPTFLSAKPRRPRTLERYEGLWRQHVEPRFGDRLLRSATPDDIGAWLVDLEAAGVGDATRAAAFRLLRSIFRAALAARLVGWSPTAAIATPTIPRREMRFLDAEEVRRLAEATPERYRTLIFLLAYGGLRIGEAAAVRLEDLDPLRGRIHVAQALGTVGGRAEIGPTKTGQVRTVSLPTFLRDMLREHLEAHPPKEVEVTYRSSPTTTETRRMRFLFGSPSGQPLRPGNFRRRVWDRATVAAGVSPLRIHDLRHTCAALLFAQGAPVKAVAERLGHSNPTVTLNTYAHVIPGLDAQLTDGLEATFRNAEATEPPAVVSIERGAER